MTDRRRREMITRYLDGAMRAEEISAFRKRLEFNAGLRRLLEAEQLIRRTFEHNRRGAAPDHAFTRKRVMAILATLPPAKGSGVLKGTVAGISHMAKATMFTVFGVGAVMIATQFAERPAEDGSTHRYRAGQTTSTRSPATTSAAVPAAVPVTGTAKRAAPGHEDPATGAQIRETAAPQRRTNTHARPSGADRVHPSPDAGADGNVNAAEPKATATMPPPNRRTLPVLRSDSVNVRVRINIHK